VSKERLPAAALLDLLARSPSGAPLPDDRHEAMSNQIAECLKIPTRQPGGTAKPSAERAYGSRRARILQGRYRLVALDAGEGGMTESLKGPSLRRA